MTSEDVAMRGLLQEIKDLKQGLMHSVQQVKR
jgi:hypothetical protein